MDHPEVTAEALRGVGDLEIVRWRRRDLPPGLDALIAEALSAGIEWMGDFEAEWRERPFLDEGEALLLALRSSRPVAMGVISADPFVKATDVGRLRYIYVADAARGRGVLTAFVELSLALGAARWRRLRLHTDNPVAARVYERYGFRSTAREERSTHMRDAQPALVAASRLADGGA